MSRTARGWRYAVLALAMPMLACGDNSTAPDEASQDVVIVSVVGIGADDAGLVLRLTGAIDHVEAARASLHVAWAGNEKDGTTVVVLGRLAEGGDVVLVRRGTGIVPFSAQLVEVAAADGSVSSPSTVRAIVRGLAR